MAFSELFTDVITKLESLQVANPISSPKKANNITQSDSNVNRIFKYVNIWNDQIDNEIKEKGYPIKCPSCLIEFIPEEPKLVLGGLTQYMDAKMYFHIFSDKLNSPSNQSRNSGDFMDRNVEIYDLRDAIKSAFLGFHTHNSSAMMSRYDSLDYRHGQITKYLLGFTFCYNDEKGSIFDPKSTRYLVDGVLTGGLEIPTARRDWIGGDSYVALVNVVYLDTVVGGSVVGFYLCTTSNNSASFTPSEWVLLPVWTSGNSYAINDYVYLGYYAYQCINANSDVTFTSSNWDLICRI